MFRYLIVNLLLYLNFGPVLYHFEHALNRETNKNSNEHEKFRQTTKPQSVTPLRS